ECSRLPRFRSLPAIACALLPGAIVRKTVSLHLQLAYRARSLYSLALAHPFFLASSSEAAAFLFWLLRGCAFSQLLIHNFRLYLVSSTLRPLMLLRVQMPIS